MPVCCNRMQTILVLSSIVNTGTVMHLPTALVGSASCVCVQPVKYSKIWQGFLMVLTNDSPQSFLCLCAQSMLSFKAGENSISLCRFTGACVLRSSLLSAFSLQHQSAHSKQPYLPCICNQGPSANVVQCVAIDPSEERVAAGDNTGRILIWNGFKEKVPTLHKASPPATAVPTTFTAAANNAAQNKPANSDSESDSDGSEDAQQDSASGQHQQPAAQPGSSKMQASGEAGSVVTSVAAPGKKSMQDNFSKLQRSRANVPVTTVHWHAHPVGTLCFSADGTLLLSGGEEAVLVSHRSHAACDCMALAIMPLYS